MGDVICFGCGLRKDICECDFDAEKEDAKSDDN